MSIAEKLTLIAENQQRVYDAGYRKGKAEGDAECYRSHVIKVNELPEDNIDEGAVYKITEPRFDDVILVSSGVKVSLVRTGYVSELCLVPTRPTENIKVSTDSKICAYYVEDQDAVLAYGCFESLRLTNNAWVHLEMLLNARYNGSFTYEGVVSDDDEATQNGYYALMGEDYRYAEYIGGEWVLSDANAVVKVNELEEQLAASFPADEWCDGECTITYSDIPIEVRYKYRRDRTDPKDIALEGTIRDVDGSERQFATLLEYYTCSYVSTCGRVAVEFGSDLAYALYDNPVVLTYADLSQYYTAYFGVAVTVRLSIAQASLKNYYGVRDVANISTVTSYFLEADMDSVVAGDIAKNMYVLGPMLYCEVFYEHTDNGEGFSYAYGGKAAYARDHFTWNDAE